MIQSALSDFPWTHYAIPKGLEEAEGAPEEPPEMEPQEPETSEMTRLRQEDGMEITLLGRWRIV